MIGFEPYIVTGGQQGGRTKSRDANREEGGGKEKEDEEEEEKTTQDTEDEELKLNKPCDLWDGGTVTVDYNLPGLLAYLGLDVHCLHLGLRVGIQGSSSSSGCGRGQGSNNPGTLGDLHKSVFSAGAGVCTCWRSTVPR